MVKEVVATEKAAAEAAVPEAEAMVERPGVGRGQQACLPDRAAASLGVGEWAAAAGAAGALAEVDVAVEAPAGRLGTAVEHAAQTVVRGVARSVEKERAAAAMEEEGLAGVVRAAVAQVGVATVVEEPALAALVE